MKEVGDELNIQSPLHQAPFPPFPGESPTLNSQPSTECGECQNEDPGPVLCIQFSCNSL